MTWSACAGLSVLVVGVACLPPRTPTRHWGTGPAPSSNPRGAAQRASLGRVWYRGQPPAPRPDDEELASANKRVAAAADFERALVNELFPRDVEMWAYITRDSDGDGILDYRVSDFLGKLLEGDTDLDGDGISNYLDDDPYVTSAAQADDGIPARLAWSVSLEKSPEMVAIQRALYARYRILLVERDAYFTPELVRSIADAVPILLERDFRSGIETLRTIATEASSLLDPLHKEGASDFAQFFAESRSLSIYRLGIAAEPIIQFGLVAHEIAHAVQTSMDFKGRQTADERDEPPTNFLTLMARFEWSAEAVPSVGVRDFALFRPHYRGLERFSAMWRDMSADEWQVALEEIDLRSAEAAALGIIGSYALSSPFEWYSDHLISYVYLTIIDSLRGMCTEAEWRALERWLEETVVDTWPDYAYANARGTPIQAELAARFPIGDEQRTALAQRYLSPDRICTGR